MKLKQGLSAGIVSCMAFNPDKSGLMAAGSYSGQAGLYDSKSLELLFLLHGQKGGLTQVNSCLLVFVYTSFTCQTTGRSS